MKTKDSQIITLKVDPDSTFTVVGDSTPIIRYMDLIKFFSLIQFNSLRFTRPDLFSDEYEGLSTINFESDGFESADIFRKMSVVSSWNHYTSESFPLWKIYLGGSKYGVAIVSKVGLLKESIIDKNLLASIIPYGVRYVDPYYSSPKMNASIVISRKKKFYEFEQEVRFAIEYGSGTSMPEGLDVGIIPSILIEEVICSPYMPTWVKDLLTVTMNNCGLASLKVSDSIVKDSMLK